jgi:hypothetical protein
MPDFEWAMFHVSQCRRIRRISWPEKWGMKWQVWASPDLGMDRPVCGWGNQIGFVDADRFEGLGTDGSYYTPTEGDKVAIDWELL